MKAQVSLGSQPQNRPQALSAQIAPAMTAKVQIGKPKTAGRWATRSSAAAGGSRSRAEKPPAVRGTRERRGNPPPAPVRAATRASYRERTRYRMLARPLTKKIPQPRIAV